MLTNRTISGPGSLLAAGLLALLAPEGTSAQTKPHEVRREGVKLPRKLMGILLAWQERARGRRDLASLDERLLNDIGLTRFDASKEAAKPFWKC